MIERELSIVREEWRFPVESPALVFEEEGESLYGIDIVGVDRLGLLHDIIEAINSRGYFIRHLAHSQRLNNKIAVFIVVDLVRSRPEVEMKHMLREICNIPGVISVVPVEKRGKIVHSRMLFPLKIASFRGIIMGRGNLLGLTEGLREAVGSTVADMILAKVGLTVGSLVYRFNQKLFNYKTIGDVIWTLNALLQSAGWGRILNYILYGNKIILQVSDPWELDLLGEESKHAEDPVFLRNALKGFFSELFKKHVETEVLQVERVARQNIVTFVVHR